MDDHCSDLIIEDSAVAYAAGEAAAAAEEEEEAAAAAVAAAAAADEEEAVDINKEEDHNATLNDDDHNLLRAGNSFGQELKCLICGKGMEEDSRALCHFLPNNVHEATLQLAPRIKTFGEEIVVHVFCGKTACILPNVTRPELEILSKAGIKNKHGIGPEVNGALARTRNCTVAADGAKEKTFYIVQEFEAHLAAIRAASINTLHHGMGIIDHSMGQQLSSSFHSQVQSLALHPSFVDPLSSPASLDPAFDPLYHHSPIPNHHLQPSTSKVIPHKASHTYQKRDPWSLPSIDVLSEGKIRCGCGGTHLPTGTAKGDSSWRSHVMTKRHQKWMEENGLLGIV
jgi:hypothetical protein